MAESAPKGWEKEIACYVQLFLFPQCFQMTNTTDT